MKHSFASAASVADGYSGYNPLKGATHCGCRPHTGRKWRETMPDGATEKTGKAAIGYTYCSKLFALDKKYAFISPQGRYEYDQNVVKPLLEEYFAWLQYTRTGERQ